MYRTLSPISPSQLAANGAMDIYVEGSRLHDLPQMLVGLSVLRSASVEQVNAAMTSVQTRRGMGAGEIAAMLAG